MDYRFLGRTGLKVSQLCLGTMTFGRETLEADSSTIMDRFMQAGGNFIDTADVYSAGTSEQIVGRWLKSKKRDDIVLATKVRFSMGGGPNDVGLSRKHILSAVDASLKRLGVDYIDLYQVHCWDAGTPVEEYVRTLNGLVDSGKVRYIGASNFTGRQLQKAIDVARLLGFESFSCLQPQYNLLCRSTEWDLIPLCINEGLGVILWSPLRGGWLSGKYHRGMSAPVPGTRIEEAERKGWGESWKAYNRESTWRVTDALDAVAKKEGKEQAQVSLNWLLQKPGVTAPIIGVRTVKHLESAIGATGWALSRESMKTLNEASDIEPPYPWDFMRHAQDGRFDGSPGRIT
jgi:aryl-alcohol dehydrogenase-like predicted oxidoreductase